MNIFNKNIVQTYIYSTLQTFIQICILLILVYNSTSCKKFPIGPQSINTNNNDTSHQAKGVFIICEGNYNWGNGTLSFYDYNTKSISNNIFYNTNSRALGDVPQSMTIKDSTGFIVINNSNKIEVINTNTFKSIATINNLNSPRYMIFINNEKAYVSSLYGNVIYIINPKTFQITGTIPTGRSTEQMILYNGKVFAANWSNGNKIFIINTINDEVITSITTTKEPNSLVLDKNNKLWVLCSGGFMQEETAKLMRINPDTYLIEKEFSFLSGAYPTKLCNNASNDTMYYLNKNIYKMSVHDTIIPVTSVIAKQNRNFYGLVIHKNTSQIYISNTLDYVQQGWIYRYSFTGIAIDSFKVDINPGEFCFN